MGGKRTLRQLKIGTAATTESCFLELISTAFVRKKALEALLMDYRRGVDRERRNNLWHFHWDCESYPNTAYSVRNDKPSDDDLCARCQGYADAKGLS